MILCGVPAYCNSLLDISLVGKKVLAPDFGALCEGRVGTEDEQVAFVLEQLVVTLFRLCRPWASSVRLHGLYDKVGRCIE